jgi:AraC family transcriptional regulator
MARQGDRQSVAGDTSGRDGVESTIRLLYARNGQRSGAALSTDVILASSNDRGWRSPLVFEIHRMSNHEYGEHRTLGHQLMINLAGSVRLGWLEDGRRCESEFGHEQMCIQSDGDTNAPRWQGDLTFATASIQPAMIESVLESRAPSSGDVFPKQHCVAAKTPAAFARALACELLSPTEPLYAQTLSLAFVLHLLAGHGRVVGRKHLAPKGKLGALQLRTVIELAHAQLADGLTLELMARAAGYSPFQFARLFKATTGLAPHQFVRSLRLERSCRLLDDQHDVADVALRTGFYDQAHFTNAFRNEFGVTPIVYARRRPMRKIFQASGARPGDYGVAGDELLHQPAQSRDEPTPGGRL